MALLGNVLGFSAIGLLSRFGQLGIQKRNLFESEFWDHSPSRTARWLPLRFDMYFIQTPPTRQHDSTWLDSPRVDPGGHVVAMATFGFAGYWAYQWDQRAAVLLAEKRAQIAEARERKAQTAAVAEAEWSRDCCVHGGVMLKLELGECTNFFAIESLKMLTYVLIGFQFYTLLLSLNFNYYNVKWREMRCKKLRGNVNEQQKPWWTWDPQNKSSLRMYTFSYNVYTHKWPIQEAISFQVKGLPVEMFRLTQRIAL